MFNFILVVLSMLLSYIEGLHESLKSMYDNRSAIE